MIITYLSKILKVIKCRYAIIPTLNLHHTYTFTMIIWLEPPFESRF